MRKKIRKEVVIYHAKTPYLKNFLKEIFFLIQLFKNLKFPKFRFDLKLLALVLIGSICIVGIYFYVFKDLPAPSSLTTKPFPLTTHIRDRHGVELYKIYASQNRTLVKLSDIPLNLRQAIIAIEDAEFYQHSGFSLRGIASASWRTLTNQQLEGGSTITQQLVKTALLSPNALCAAKSASWFSLS